MTTATIAFYSNLSSLWPIAKQRAAAPEGIKKEFTDILNDRQRRTKNPKHLKERKEMLRPTTRPGQKVIWFADWPVLACNADDLSEVLAQGQDIGAVFLCGASGMKITPRSTPRDVNQAIVALREAVKQGTLAERGRAGGAASAARKIAETEAAAKVHEHLWKDSSYTILQIEKLSGISRNSLKKYLGRDRERIMRNHEQALKRKAKREADHEQRAG
jgi:hypothetical protein